MLVAQPVVGDDPFAVILADDLMDSQPPAMARMAEIFEREQCSLLGVEEVPRDQTQSYGIVTIDKMQGDTARIHAIVEKPKPKDAPSNLAVILADDLMEPPAMARMAQVFAREGASLLGVEEVPRDQTQSYGIVTIDKMQGDLARIHSIVEKPKPAAAPSNLAVIGRYVLTPRIFELLAAATPGAGGEIQLTDAISALLAHERVLALRLPGRRYDCGSKLGYLQAAVELGAKHPEVGAEFARYLSGLRDA